MTVLMAPSALRWPTIRARQRRAAARAAEAEQRLSLLLADAEAAHDDLVAASADRLGATGAVLARLGAALPVELRAWTDGAWTGWDPPPRRAGGHVRIGRLLEGGADLPADLPATVAWPTGGPLVVRAGAEHRAEALDVVRAIVWRSLVSPDRPAAVTVVDPGGALRSSGSDPWDVAPASDPATVLGDLRRALHGDGSLRLLVVVDHPAAYDRRGRMALGACTSSPPANVRILVHDQTGGPTADGLVDLSTAHVLDVPSPPVSLGAGATLTAGYDRPPPEPVARHLRGVLAATSAEPTLAWDDLGHPDPGQWWGEDAGHELRTPVGRRPDGAPLELHLGAGGPGRRPCAHGVVVAMTGAGKTGLLHALICGLAVRYGPEELRFLLVDGKSGVGFAPYRDLPHAAVVVLRARPALARSVLEEAVGEMERRHERFKQAGVEDLAAHRAAGSPGGRLARLVVVVDEFQMLFDGDRDGTAATALLRLSEQARSAGIHLLLGSQHFAPRRHGPPGPHLRQPPPSGGHADGPGRGVHLRGLRARGAPADHRGLRRGGSGGRQRPGR